MDQVIWLGKTKVAGDVRQIRRSFALAGFFCYGHIRLIKLQVYCSSQDKLRFDQNKYIKCEVMMF